MKKIKFILSGTLLFCILCSIFTLLTHTLIPKFYGEWASTYTYEGFYEVPKDTVDVIFLGSSHAASFFCPNELESSYGIISYNLGCEQQNLLTSYYWLKEALRYQSPKTVILETYFLYPYTLEEETPVMNFHEPSMRKAFDNMHFSLNKINAAIDIHSHDDTQSISSYLVPLATYHSRWTELTEDDFTHMFQNHEDPNKGYAPLTYLSDYEMSGLPIDNETETEPMLDSMETYLDKIAALCRQKDIQLILVTTPTNQWTQARHNMIAQYAAANNITYLDCCSESFMQETGYCFATDNSDYGHGNTVGAAKVTDYIGFIITNN